MLTSITPKGKKRTGSGYRRETSTEPLAYRTALMTCVPELKAFQPSRARLCRFEYVPRTRSFKSRSDSFPMPTRLILPFPPLIGIGRETEIAGILLAKQTPRCLRRGCRVPAPLPVAQGQGRPGTEDTEFKEALTLRALCLVLALGKCKMCREQASQNWEQWKQESSC